MAETLKGEPLHFTITSFQYAFESNVGKLEKGTPL